MMNKLTQTLLPALLIIVGGAAHGQSPAKTLELESLKSLSSSSAQLHLPVESWQTPQGSKVLFVPSQELPMFDLQVVFDAGSARDDGSTGLAKLTLEMLKKGTTQRDVTQIAEGFDEIGAKFGTSINRDKATIRVRSLSSDQHRDKAVELLAEVLGQPLFATDTLQEVKDQLINASAQRQTIASQKALDRLFEHTYADHPFAANDAQLSQTIGTLEIADLEAFHQNAMNAGNAIITLVGDLSSEKAHELAEQISAALPAGSSLPPMPGAPAFEPEIYHLEHPGTQSLLLLAIPGIGAQHEDAPALTLLNLILGGQGSNSRLYDELRTQRGLTYGASSALAKATDSGLWIFSTEVEAKYQDATMTLLESLLESYAETGPSEQQIADAKEQLRGSYLLDSVSNSQISRTLANIGLHQLPLDSRQAFLEQVQTLTQDQLNVALKKHLKLDKLVQISVGPSVEQHDLPEPAPVDG